MKFFILAATALVFSACASRPAENVKEGWTSLFDGKTTAGWHSYGKQTAGTQWKVVDGAIFYDSKNQQPGQGGDLVTDKEYENFHLKLEWKISKNGNSGIIFNVHEDAVRYPATYLTGPEMQIIDNDGHPDAKFEKHRAGDLYDLIASSSEVARPVGEWNLAEVIVNNGRLDLKLNGVAIVTTNMWDENWKKMVAGSKFKTWQGFAAYKSGKIALQDHGNDVWFRNIAIKELNKS